MWALKGYFLIQQHQSYDNNVQKKTFLRCISFTIRYQDWYVCGKQNGFKFEIVLDDIKLNLGSSWIEEDGLNNNHFWIFCRSCMS